MSYIPDVVSGIDYGKLKLISDLLCICLKGAQNKDFTTLEIDVESAVILLNQILAEMISVATTPVIYNVTLTNADQEYSQLLPNGTKKFTISERNGNPFRLAFETGRVAVPTEPYKTILSNQVYWEDDVNLVGVTLYLAAPVGGRVIEIICWT